MKLDVGYSTDPGPRRGANQDSVKVEMLGEEGALLILSDGMGGARAGEYASREAVSVIYEQITNEPPTAENASERLYEAVMAANASIFEQGQAAPEKHGMGCTVVAVLVLGTQYWVASVGDSRVYLIRGERAHQLTTDHTWVNARVRDGVITKEEASNHSLRHVLDRALGTRPNVEIDVFPPRQLEGSDVLLLCSDGLYSVLDDTFIAVEAEAYPAQEAADTLVRQALSAHTHDNVSVVILQAGR